MEWHEERYLSQEDVSIRTSRTGFDLGRRGLDNLYLAWNQLSGEIPPELGNLTGLQALVLGDNQLSGEWIPIELGDLRPLLLVCTSARIN